MIYPITVYGHPVLRKVTKDITKDYENLDTLIEDMYHTMYRTDGIGLAAPQIGKSIRMFVVDISPLGDEIPECKDFKKVFFNAQIIEREGDEVVEEEGCLSIPGIREKVTRKDRIRITYYDENFEFHDEVYEGWPARVLQHEYDHLDGILFVDHVSSLRKRLLRGKLTSIAKGKAKVSYRIINP